MVSARIESLLRPSVNSSPLPKRMYWPSLISRAISASPYRDTILARIFDISDSGRVGYCSNSFPATDSPSTASPRNSRRSLLGSMPFSLANDRWVSARVSMSWGRSTPRAASRGAWSTLANSCSRASVPVRRLRLRLIGISPNPTNVDQWSEPPHYRNRRSRRNRRTRHRGGRGRVPPRRRRTRRGIPG